MQFALRATRRTPQDASRSWCKQCLRGWSKPDVLRPGVAGMRGSVVIRLRLCTNRAPAPRCTLTYVRVLSKESRPFEAYAIP